MELGSPTHSTTVRNTMKGIRRALGTASGQKSAVLTDDVRATIEVSDTGVIGARDRAMLLLGFAGAFRRSEIVALDVEDCLFGRDGLIIALYRSKTDQEGQGRKLGIPYGSNHRGAPMPFRRT